MNNADLYNAVLSGISGSNQNVRQGVTTAGDYTRFADRGVILATAVDNLIAPMAVTTADTLLMGQIVAGLDLNRCFVGTTPNYASIAADIVTLWTEFRGRISPSSLLPLTIEVDTIAQLRALPFNPNLVYVKRYAGIGSEGGGGWFEYLANDVTSLDDSGVYIVNAVGGRFLRDGADSGNVDVRWFGAVGDLSFTVDGAFHIVPASITGGSTDESGILAARTFAVANKRPLYIPSGCYLWTTNQFEFEHTLKVFGDDRATTIIVSRRNKPFKIGTMTSFRFDISLKDISLLCYEDHTLDPDPWVGIDLYAMTMSTLEFAARGWDYNVRAVHTNINPLIDIRGEVYQSRIYCRSHSASAGLPFAPRSGTICHIEGAVNGSTFSCDAQNPTVASLVLTGGLRGNLGSTITVDYVQSDSCPNAVVIEDGYGITVHHVYAESCANSVAITNCKLVEISNIRGGDVVVTDCQGVAFGESVAALFNHRSTVINRGASFGENPKSVVTDNVGVLCLGHNYDTGTANSHPGCQHSQVDARNLFCNGAFTRWVSGVPWLWATLPGYVNAFIQCGEGLVDTTHSSGVLYSAHLLGQTSGSFFVCGPIGEQYLGTTVSVSLKCKYIAGYAGLTLTSWHPLSTDISGSRAINEVDTWIPCPGEEGAANGWVLITFVWTITQAMCDDGIGLQIQSNVDCDAYLDEIMVQFGVAAQRGYLPVSDVMGGDCSINRIGKIEINTTTEPTVIVDPITGQSLQAGDVAKDTSGNTPGWRRTNKVWLQIEDNESDVYIRRIILATGNKLVRAVVGEDLPVSGDISLWPARVGADCMPASTGRATVGQLRGRRAAIFSASAQAQGYVFEGALPEYWCISRWDDALPFPSYSGMIGGQTTAGIGVRLIGNSGASAILASGTTLTKDGVVDLTVVSGISNIWRVSGVAGVDGRQIGGSDSAAVNNWRGAISVGLGFNAALTTEEAETVLSLSKVYTGK